MIIADIRNIENSEKECVDINYVFYNAIISPKSKANTYNFTIIRLDYGRNFTQEETSVNKKEIKSYSNIDNIVQLNL